MIHQALRGAGRDGFGSREDAMVGRRRTSEASIDRYTRRSTSYVLVHRLQK